MKVLAFNLLKGKTLMTLRLCFVLLCLPSFAALAQGQIQIRRVEEPGVDTYTFRNDRCNDTLNLSWNNQLLVSLSNVQCGQFPLKLWATASTCGDEPLSGDHIFDEVQAAVVDQTRKGTFAIKVSDLPGLKSSTGSDGGTIPGCDDTTPRTVVHHVCGLAQYAVQSGFQCTTPTKLKASSLKLVFDTEPPAAPTLTEVIAQDTAARVNFSVGTDTQKVFLQVKGPNETDFTTKKEALASAATVQAEGLENEKEYIVRLVAADGAGNLSGPSAEAKVIPIKTVGLWGYYQDHGGTDTTAGCSVGLELAPLLLGLWALRRERRRL